MNIVFASIFPHPSSALPTIGSESDIKRVSKTVNSMKKLARELAASKPDAVVVISPHIPVNFTSFSIIESPDLKGHLYKFGDFKTEMNFKNHTGMVSAIKKICAGERIPLRSFNDPEIDYGTIIPLHFISQEYPKVKVIPLGVSGLSAMEHVNFGRSIAKAAKECKAKIAVVVSGELSHRLSPSSTAGYSPKGKEFDLNIVELLKKGDDDAIIEIDSETLEESGECGFLPMAILFGAMEDIPWKGEILSYESPFGIGYLTAKLKISKKK